MINIVDHHGVVALLFAIPYFCRSWRSLLSDHIPLAIIGAIVGAASSSNAGRNLNLFVSGVGVLRLMLTGGLF